MKLNNRQLTTEQATCHTEVRDWAERISPLPIRFSPEPGDREAILAALAARRANPSPWEVVATPFAHAIDRAIDQR